MTGSDELTKKIGTAMEKERAVNDTYCRAHRAQTDQLRWIVRAMITVGLAVVAAGAGWVFTISGDARAHTVQIMSLEKRVDREVTEIKEAILRTETEVKDSNQRMEERFRRLNDRIDTVLQGD